MGLIPLLPDAPTPTPPPGAIEAIHPPGWVDPSLWSGEWYWRLVIIFGSILFIFFILHIIVKIWGDPILKAKSAHTGGKAIVQHFENSRIASLKLAMIGGGAIRHDRVEDGTLITIPKGINNLRGLQFVNSWNLTGISLPVFLMGAITKLRQMGITNGDMLKAKTGLDNDTVKEVFKEATGEELETCDTDILDTNTNLITEAYDFNNFKDIVKKANDPNFIPLEIEHTNDFIPSINQHYTESDITLELKSRTMNAPDKFTKMFMVTCIGLLIAAIGIYLLVGSIK